MKLDKSLCSMVVNSIQSQNIEDLDEIDRLIVECLTYYMTNTLLSNGMIESGAIGDTTDRYAASYISTVKTMKKKYTSYSVIKKYLLKKKISSIFEADFTILDQVADIYEARKEIMIFDPYTFNPLMYNVSNLTSNYFNRLGKIHQKIMTPIYLYYQKKYNIEPNDFIIEDILEVPSNPGKMIQFRIEGVSSALICAHINMDVISIRQYLYNITIRDESVLITVK